MNPVTLLCISLLVIFGLMLVPIVFGPLLIKLVFSAKANPEVRTIDPYKNPPPPDICQFFNYVDAELKQVGFAPTAHLLVPEVVANVDSYLMYMQNPQTQIEVVGIAAFARNADPMGGRMQSKAVEFATRFRDGGSLDTNNSQEEYALYRPPNKVLHQFQQVLNPQRLYQIHLQLLKDMGGPACLPMIAKEQQARAVADSMKEEFAAQVPAGILFLNPSLTHYKPTLIGAYKITLPNVFPFKQFRRMRRKSKCEKMLSRWGI